MADEEMPQAVVVGSRGGGPRGGGGRTSTIGGGGSSAVIPRSCTDRQCLTWSRVTPSMNSGIVPPPRSGAASVVVKGRLYVFGGYGGGTGRLDDFYSFSFETGTWEQVMVLSQEKPGCRENNGVVISDTSKSIYLFGGYNGHSWLNDLWKFDIETKRWTCIQESSDSNNFGSAEDDTNNPRGGNNNNDNQDVVAVGGNAVAVAPGVAGANANAVGALPVAMAVEHAAGAASNNHNVPNQVRGKVPSRRFGYVSVVHEGKFVLFGGFDGARWLNDMYVFDFATKTWTEIQGKGTLPTVRSCPAWAKDDTHVYIQGGYDGVERKADFFACDLATYTWTEMPCLGTPPSPRYFHSCCLYGNKMYLYGGYSGSERLADMYAYDFETNHWSQVDCTSGDAPSGRSSLVAQVYENCLYIFGGYNGTTVLNDFYRFRLKPIAVPPPALTHDFSKLINNPELADVRFSVEGRDVFAHKAILAIRSEYFRVMLCGGMRESSHSHALVTTAIPVRTTSANGAAGGEEMSLPGAIELPHVSHHVFLKVLEFLYTDTVRSVSLETSIHLLIASEQFMLDRLKALCEDLIRRDITVETVIGILVASHRHNASGLKDIALEFILRNLNDTAVMTGLSELKTEPDLLLEIIRRNSGGGQGGGGSGSSPFQSGSSQEYSSGPFGAAAAEWDARR